MKQIKLAAAALTIVGAMLLSFVGCEKSSDTVTPPVVEPTSSVMYVLNSLGASISVIDLTKDSPTNIDNQAEQAAIASLIRS